MSRQKVFSLYNLTMLCYAMLWYAMICYARLCCAKLFYGKCDNDTCAAATDNHDGWILRDRLVLDTCFSFEVLISKFD